MDLRIKKTRTSIINAFLTLRSKKPLERITVKELSNAAQINKATFYLHYKDIYDLSETLENELFENVFNSIEHPDAVVSDPRIFIKELIEGFTANQTLIDIIFSNERRSILVDRIDKELKKFLFEKHPEYKEIAEINVLLTYSIKGGYYAFSENRECDPDILVSVISDTAEYITRLIEKTAAE
ncbi:MAG: TetR/AcrR family transcriptional regulator [Oscillospiraceae bacterium]|nr:TetR/AcrR family transcriptional regulator [Oscillospiraceae bacterium]